MMAARVLNSKGSTKFKGFCLVNANIRRIALQPGVRGGGFRLGGEAATTGNDDETAGAGLAIAGHSSKPSLSPNPKIFI
jgi:hypothetical protein